jgi:POT family proton-dependent oligopeptide transporter
MQQTANDSPADASTPGTQAKATSSGSIATGHPRGLYTLFFTEMWERLGYYGMRALLVLFMGAAVASGGLGLDDKTAAAIYGLFTCSVYLAALPGGWIADRLLGSQRSVLVGGVIIALGYFTLAVPRIETFYLGLILVVLGTGLLKPNVSAIVGQLYPEGGARRDAGFTLFYMGINIGAMLGPLVCSYLGEKVNWRLGFAAAGVGMVLGLLQFQFTRRNLGQAGQKQLSSGPGAVRDWGIVAAAVGLITAVYLLVMLRVLRLDPRALASYTAYAIVAIAVIYFASLFLFAGLDAREKKRLGVVVVLFVASAIFWAGFEQAGSSLNIFADRFTHRVVSLGKTFEIPAGWLQSFSPIFVITLAPAVAAVWVSLSRRGKDISLLAKFALGLLLLAVGFLVMAGASAVAASGKKALPTWLIATYLFHSLGELCISPVGLSSVTKLAPPRLVGQMMGLWFLATSLGNLIAGLTAGRLTSADPARMPAMFLTMVGAATAVALVLWCLNRPIKRLMSGDA